MECLTNLIGLDGCTTGDELYKLNQVGLSLGQLEDLLPDGYDNVDDWLVASKELAAKELSTDVVNFVSSSVEVQTVLENDVAGIYSERLRETTGTQFAGLYFDLWNETSYAKLQISSIKFFGKHAGDIDIKIINLLNGEELKSITITAVADKVVEVPVSIEVKSKMRDLKVAIVYDANGITSYETNMTNAGCASCGNRNGYRSNLASINPLNISSPFVIANKTSRNDTAGLSVDYSWVCDQEQFVCAMSGSLALAYLYKVAYNLIALSLNSFSQFSEQVTTNRENNEERAVFYQTEYESQMSKFLQNARIPKNICFTCNPKVGIRNVLPG